MSSKKTKTVVINVELSKDMGTENVYNYLDLVAREVSKEKGSEVNLEGDKGANLDEEDVRETNGVRPIKYWSFTELGAGYEDSSFIDKEIEEEGISLTEPRNDIGRFYINCKRLDSNKPKKPAPNNTNHG